MHISFSEHLFVHAILTTVLTVFNVLPCNNENLPVIGILIVCLTELVDECISVISKHSQQQMFPGKPIHQANVNKW